MSTSFALPQTEDQTAALIEAVVTGFAGVPAQDGWTAEPLDRSDVMAIEGQAIVIEVGASHSFAIVARKSLVAAIDLEYPDRGLLGVLGPALESIARSLGGEVSAADAIRTTAADFRSRLGDGDLVAVSVFDDGSLRATVVLGRVGSDGPRPQSAAGDSAPSVSTGAGATSFPAVTHVDAADVQSVSFPSIEIGAQQLAAVPASVGILSDVQMGVSVELGRARMSVREILSLTLGSVIELDRPAGAPVDLFVNGTLIARGEVVVIDEEFGVRVSEVIGYRAEGSVR